jgi:hypothetical protein
MFDDAESIPALFEIFVNLIVIQDFQSPITWVMVGSNGAVLRGVWKFSLDPEADLSERSNLTVLAGRARDLRFPINLFVTERGGRTVNILFEKERKDKPVLQEVGQG